MLFPVCIMFFWTSVLLWCCGSCQSLPQDKCLDSLEEAAGPSQAQSMLQKNFHRQKAAVMNVDFRDIPFPQQMMCFTLNQPCEVILPDGVVLKGTCATGSDGKTGICQTDPLNTCPAGGTGEACTFANFTGVCGTSQFLSPDEACKFVTYQGPGQQFCINKLSESPSNGKADCESKCCADVQCSYYSLWSTGGLNWCRLSSVCDEESQQKGQTVTIYKKLSSQADPEDPTWLSHPQGSGLCTGGYLSGSATAVKAECEQTCKEDSRCQYYCHATDSSLWSCLQYTTCPTLYSELNYNTYSCHQKADAKPPVSEEACNESSSALNAVDYRGCRNQTISGRTCQKWSANSPHAHINTPEQNPGKGLGDHNYCRNPENLAGGVWCYTTDPAKRFEHCSLQANDTTTTPSALEACNVWLQNPTTTTTTTDFQPGDCVDRDDIFSQQSSSAATCAGLAMLAGDLCEKCAESLTKLPPWKTSNICCKTCSLCSSDSPDNATCPSSCQAPTCVQGASKNGGLPLQADKCNYHCSKPFSGKRYCGIGSEYTSAESIDCSGCAGGQYVHAADGSLTCPDGYHNLNDVDACSRGLSMAGTQYKWSGRSGCLWLWPYYGCFSYGTDLYFSTCDESQRLSQNAHNGICKKDAGDEVDKCPSACQSPACYKGGKQNGGVGLVDGKCFYYCSQPFAGQRFCGTGSEYTGGDSVDCTGCLASAGEYVKASDGSSACPTGYVSLDNVNACKTDITIAGVKHTWSGRSDCEWKWPRSGCFAYEEKLYFSLCGEARPLSQHSHSGICRKAGNSTR